MYKILFFFAFTLPINVISQNECYQFVSEKINPILDSSYWEAKKMWTRYEKKQVIDPTLEIFFLGDALKNNDIRFFKKRIKRLIRDYGFKYSSFDTSLTENSGTNLNELFHKKDLVNYMLKLNSKYYGTWVKSNLNSNEIRDNLKDIMTKDQHAIISLTFSESSFICDSMDVLLLERLHSLNVQHFHNLMSLITKIGRLPNNYDDGFYSYNVLQIIVWHNLKVKSSFKDTWSLIFPYYEKAYLDGKVNDDLFWMYDQMLSKHEGKQYYGYLGKNVPIEDEENFNARKEKYKLWY